MVPHPNVVPVLGTGRGDLDRRSGRGVPDRILNQVREGALKHETVASKRHLIGKVQKDGDAPSRRGQPKAPHGVLDGLGQIEWLIQDGHETAFRA